MSGYYQIPEHIKILLIEDSESDAGLIQAHLSRSKSQPVVHHEEMLADGIDWLKHDAIDIVLLDLNLPDSDGLNTFTDLYREFPATPVVILAGQAHEEMAITAISLGAQDYLSKSKIDADSLSRSIRYAIERGRRQRAEKELSVAAEIQMGLLPQMMPELPGFELAGRCDPAEWVGGDYFDFFQAPDDRTLWIAVGDVCGHGTGAALFMADLRAVIRTLANTLPDANLGDIFGRANRLLQNDLRAGGFVSAFLARLNVETREVTYATAGHPGYRISAEGSVEILSSEDDPPIGVNENHLYSSNKLVFNPGDVLTVFTDGIWESHTNVDDLFGIERSCDLLVKHLDKTPQWMIDELFVASIEFHGDTPREDDMTAIIVKATA